MQRKITRALVSRVDSFRKVLAITRSKLEVTTQLIDQKKKNEARLRQLAEEKTPLLCRRNELDLIDEKQAKQRELKEKSNQLKNLNDQKESDDKEIKQIAVRQEERTKLRKELDLYLMTKKISERAIEEKGFHAEFRKEAEDFLKKPMPENLRGVTIEQLDADNASDVKRHNNFIIRKDHREGVLPDEILRLDKSIISIEDAITKVTGSYKGKDKKQITEEIARLDEEQGTIRSKLQDSKTLTALEEEQKDLQESIQHLDQTLSDPVLIQLNDNPQALFNDLLKRTKQALGRFKQAYLRDNRKESLEYIALFEKYECYLDMEHKNVLNNIKNKGQKENDGQVIAYFQQRCFELMNLVNVVHACLTAPSDEVSVLKEELASVIKYARFDYEEAACQFDQLKKKYSAITYQHVNEFKYQRALQKLKQAIDPYKSQIGFAALNEFVVNADALINADINHYGYTYLTDIFKTATKMINDPNSGDKDENGDTERSRALKELATRIMSEQPSRCEAGVGIIMSIVSALVFILGVIAKFVTLGLSTPVSTPLMNAGSLGLFAGVSIYIHGSRHTGLSRSTLDLDESMKKLRKEKTFANKTKYNEFWKGVNDKRDALAKRNDLVPEVKEMKLA